MCFGKEKSEDRVNSRQPEDTAFQQQRLKAWQPLLTPKWVVILFLSVGIIFCIIGAIILGTTSSIQEYTIRYDNLPVVNGVTTIPVTFTSNMNGPLYLYYKLDNFYQNHRRYVKSRSDIQLEGTPTDISNCDPIAKNSTGSVYYPCGLIANSFFRDHFDGMLCQTTYDPITGVCNGNGLKMLGNGTDPVVSNPLWQKSGIAWPTDVTSKFVSVDLTSYINSQAITLTSYQNYTLPQVTDEDFIVWMRTAGLPSFKKLYRIINIDKVTQGQTLIITTNNNYPVSSFNGQKSIVVGNVSWLGSKNNFLGWGYVTVGIYAVVVALAFFVKSLVSPRPLGDLKYFKWSK